MHTIGSPRCAHSSCTIIHRDPVGSHATVSPENPAARARPAAQSSTAPSSCTLTCGDRRASTCPSAPVTTSACFLSPRSSPATALPAGTIARNRAIRAFRRRSPRVIPLPLLIGRPPVALGHQARICTGGRSHLRHPPETPASRATSYYYEAGTVTGGVLGAEGAAGERVHSG